MPRAHPVNARKKMVLSHIVEGNDYVRLVAGKLRLTDSRITMAEVDQCLTWLTKAQQEYDTAITALTYLKNAMEQRRSV